jgi:hypothetical protein
MKINFEDAVSTIKPWEHYIICELLKQGKVPPVVPKRKQKIEFAGGWCYIKKPYTKTKALMLYDITSSYPNQIIAYNISPDTFIPYEQLPKDLQEKITPYLSNPEKEINNFENVIGNLNKIEKEITPLLEKYNYTMTPAGYVFSKDKIGFIPKIIKEMFTERVTLKKEMKKLGVELYNDKENIDLFQRHYNADLMQLTLKIALNSLYGAFGINYFQYYNIAFAISITRAAQLSIRGVISHLELKEFPVIYSDTDSCFIQIEHMINSNNDIVDEALKLEPILFGHINEFLERMTKMFNHTERRIYMEMEDIFEAGLFVVKKRYVCKIIYADGIRKNSYKYSRSFTTYSRFVRDKFKTALDILFTPDLNNYKLQEYLNKLKQEFYIAPKELISFDKSLKEMTEMVQIDFSKSIFKAIDLNIEEQTHKLIPVGTPIHRLASLKYNELIDNLKLPYVKIEAGDKIKFVYVKPNAYETKVIATNTKKYTNDIMQYFNIDYDLQWEKTMYASLEPLLMTLGLKGNLLHPHSSYL